MHCNVVIDVFVIFLILISIHNQLKSHPSKVERNGKNAVTFAEWPHDEYPFCHPCHIDPCSMLIFYPQSFEGGKEWEKRCDICRMAS